MLGVRTLGAMSSYLFIIKSELPLVIGTFLDMDPERGWFLKGNLLIVIVSVVIILPLALMRPLGYLGYTSGLSLTCILFFLILAIYKKFQLGCVVGHNETVVESKSPPGLPSQGFNRNCEAQMFTVYSQGPPQPPASSSSFLASSTFTLYHLGWSPSIPGPRSRLCVLMSWGSTSWPSV
ncbi:Sodium-coupled neutral amino acid transporter 5 [Manis javanica]|nr:Sodium-coupled neutral amino acid transporter 5 [Manis javanica]